MLDGVIFTNNVFMQNIVPSFLRYLAVQTAPIMTEGSVVAGVDFSGSAVSGFFVGGSVTGKGVVFSVVASVIPGPSVLIGGCVAGEGVVFSSGASVTSGPSVVI